MVQRKVKMSKPSEPSKSWFNITLPVDLNYDPNKSMSQKWREFYLDFFNGKQPRPKPRGTDTCAKELSEFTMQRKQNGEQAAQGWFGFDTPSGEEDPEFENKSFIEKWRAHVKKKKETGSSTLAAQTMMRLLMLFQAPTQIYMFMAYIVPYVFSECDPWTIYYVRVFCWFCFTNGLGNWLCVILYDPGYPKTRDNPFLNLDRMENPPDKFIPLIESASNQNGHCVYDMTTKEGLPWEFCEKCNMHVPPRAHHCKFCKKCILKRDHHCFMVGNCIGFKNQRYFIVLAFYSMLIGGVGCYFNYRYLSEVYWPTVNSWTDLVFPVAIWRWLFYDTPGYGCLLVFHMVLEPLFGFIGFVYFTSQLAMTMEGKTLFEVAKKVPIKNTSTVSRNMRSVFGDFWLLNFLFPMTLIFRQRDDGIHWDGVKIDHNMNEKWKDDGEIL